MYVYLVHPISKLPLKSDLQVPSTGKSTQWPVVFQRRSCPSQVSSLCPQCTHDLPALSQFCSFHFSPIRLSYSVLSFILLVQQNSESSISISLGCIKSSLLTDLNDLV